MDRNEMIIMEEKRKVFKREQDYGLRYVCSLCGSVLKTELHYEDEDWLVKVLPCDICYLCENIQGYNEGYDRGYEAGFEDI